MAAVKVGTWTVAPALNLIERDGVSVKLEPRAMDLLVYFVKAGSRVVSVDDLLRDVWQGRVFDDGIVYKKINQLRKALGDERRAPSFIETIPKRGYRLVAAVTPATTDEVNASVGTADAMAHPNPTSGASHALGRGLSWAAAGLGAAVVAAALLASSGTTSEGQKPVVQSPPCVAGQF